VPLAQPITGYKEMPCPGKVFFAVGRWVSVTIFATGFVCKMQLGFTDTACKINAHKR
jgi:hypothetical protein